MEAAGPVDGVESSAAEQEAEECRRLRAVPSTRPQALAQARAMSFLSGWTKRVENLLESVDQTAAKVAEETKKLPSALNHPTQHTPSDDEDENERDDPVSNGPALRPNRSTAHLDQHFSPASNDPASAAATAPSTLDSSDLVESEPFFGRLNSSLVPSVAAPERSPVEFFTDEALHQPSVDLFGSVTANIASSTTEGASSSNGQGGPTSDAAHGAGNGSPRENPSPRNSVSSNTSTGSANSETDDPGLAPDDLTAGGWSDEAFGPFDDSSSIFSASLHDKSVNEPAGDQSARGAAETSAEGPPEKPTAMTLQAKPVEVLAVHSQPRPKVSTTAATPAAAASAVPNRTALLSPAESAKLQDLTAQISALKSANAHLTQQHQALADQLAQAQARADRQQLLTVRQLRHTEDQFEELQATFSDYKQRAQQVLGQKEELLSKLLASASSTDGGAASASAGEHRTAEASPAAEATIAQHQAVISQLKSERETLRSTIDQLEAALDEVRRATTEALSASEEEKASLQASIQEMDEQVSKKKTQVGSLLLEMDLKAQAHQDQVAQLQERIRQAVDMVEQREAELARTKRQLLASASATQPSNKVVQLEEKVKSLSDQLIARQLQLDTLIYQQSAVDRKRTADLEANVTKTKVAPQYRFDLPWWHPENLNTTLRPYLAWFFPNKPITKAALLLYVVMLQLLLFYILMKSSPSTTTDPIVAKQTT